MRQYDTIHLWSKNIYKTGKDERWMDTLIAWHLSSRSAWME